MDWSRRVLIITNNYLNIRSGGSMASLSFINAISSIFHDCSLIYPDNGKQVSHLLLPAIKAIPCRDNRPLTLKGLGMYLGKIHRFGLVTKNYLKVNRPDIVIFDTSIVSSGIIRKAAKSGAMIITNHHNVEVEYFRDNLPPLAYRSANRFYIKRSEKMAVRISNLNLTLTCNDMKKLAELYGTDKLTSFRCIRPFETYQSQNVIARQSNRKGIRKNVRLAITGSLGFRQSDLSIKNFILGKWNIALSEIPGSELVIAGRNPTKSLSSLCSQFDNIQLIPDPVSFEEIIDESDIYVCPVDRGSGFKYRIMDALKSGKPVIAHKVSSAGYEPFVDSGIMFVYDSDDSFAVALGQAAANQDRRDEIIELYSEIFSFETGVRRIKELFEGL